MFSIPMDVKLMYIYCDILGKSWYPYYKHALIFSTLRYLLSSSLKSLIPTRVGNKRGNDKKLGGREGIEPTIKRVSTYVLFLVTRFL